MTPIRLLYVTTRNTDEARQIAIELVKRRLIACANILPNMESIYRWDGEVQNESEAVLILKTEESLVSPVTAAVKDLHSYETPCVLSLAVESGAQGYLNWLMGETQKA